ncbi:MAG: hypothetical protein IT310_03220 [Anaerolineales bacterium]|nr:hypothetical protein [Anaerolineales bacterium]
MSVSAPNLPSGTRLNYFNENVLGNFDLPPGGNYNPSTINTRIATGLIDDAVSKSSIITAGITSVASNLYEYGNNAENFEEFSDQTFENQQFWVSTGVDTTLSILVGVAAATIVAGALTFFGVATFPLWGSILLVAGVSIAISGLVDYFKVPDTLDTNANMLIDDLQGE